MPSETALAVSQSCRNPNHRRSFFHQQSNARSRDVLKGSEMNTVPDWRLAGDWFDICSCNIPCPCEFAQAPTNNVCSGVLAWHIREGHFGDVQLDGLNLLALSTFEGNVWRVEIPGRVVGHATALSGPTTPPGKRVQTINPPGSEVGPGQVATWGRSVELRTDGFGFAWTGESWSSKHIPFDWTGPSSPLV
jgi:hypothetical protein